MIGFYHSIETLGTRDGKGIRFVLFLQGCLMRCKFCHNPDTWSTKGKEITVKEAIDEIKTYLPYYEYTGGGLTVCGGEPLLQPIFVRELFRSCRLAGISTTLDTSGFGGSEDLSQILCYTDEVLFSIKIVDKNKHQWLTGFSNEKILKNLNQVATRIPQLTVRYVVIPGINDNGGDLKDFIMLVNSLPNKVTIELLPYHRLGIYKWKLLKLQYELIHVPEPTVERMAEVKQILQEMSRNHVTII